GMLALRGEAAVTWDNLSKFLQIAGAALGIPAAAAGTYSAYRTYFSTDVACQNLKSAIVATMEKNVPADTKRALVNKDMADFEKACGADGHGQEFLRAVATNLESPAAAPARVKTAAATPSGSPPGACSGSPPPAPAPPVQTAATEPAPIRGPLAGIPFSALPPVGFAEVRGGDRKGWVPLALAAAAKRDDVNFDGFLISEKSLPPPGTVLTARWVVPIWREPPGPQPGDLHAAQGRLRPRDCVRVIATKAAPDRLWAEVAPASCP